MIIILVEIVVGFLVAMLVLTQVVIPVFQNRRLFPMFRKVSNLESKLTELNEVEAEQKLEAQIDKRQAELSPVPKQEVPSESASAELNRNT